MLWIPPLPGASNQLQGWSSHGMLTVVCLPPHSALHISLGALPPLPRPAVGALVLTPAQCPLPTRQLFCPTLSSNTVLERPAVAVGWAQPLSGSCQVLGGGKPDCERPGPQPTRHQPACGVGISCLIFIPTHLSLPSTK